MAFLSDAEDEDPSSLKSKIINGLFWPAGFAWLAWDGFTNGSKGYFFGRYSWKVYVPLPPFEETVFLVGFAAMAVCFHLNYFWSSWGWFDVLRRLIVRLSFVIFCAAYLYVFVYACIHFKQPE